MTHTDLQRWLEDYVAAWASRDADRIGDLFTEDAAYSYRPWQSEEHTVRGRDAIVAAWLNDETPASEWEAAYEPYAVEGDHAVAVGWTRYQAVGEHPERTYHNVMLLRFGNSGRCSQYAESYLVRKD